MLAACDEFAVETPGIRPRSGLEHGRAVRLGYGGSDDHHEGDQDAV